MNFKTSSRAALLAAVVVAGGLIFFFSSRGGFSWQSGEIDLAALSRGIGLPSGSVSGGAGGSETGTEGGAEQGRPAHRFSHRAPDFSFDLPAGFTAGAFTDDNGETVLVRGPQNAEFQIYITPQDADFAVTQARIAHDVPGTAVADAKNIRLDGASGMLFTSENASLGPTRELWFERARFLYQATSRVAAGDAMIAIMGTWRFSE